MHICSFILRACHFRNQSIEYLNILKYSNGISLCMHAKSLQLCQTLCDPMDCSPPGSSVRGILCAKILKWVALSYSGDLPNPRIEPSCPMSPALAGRFFTAGIGNLIITRPEGLKLGLHKVKEWTFIWYGVSLLMWLLGLHIVDSWSLKGRLRRLEAGVMR